MNKINSLQVALVKMKIYYLYFSRKYRILISISFNLGFETTISKTMTNEELY